MSTSSPTPTPAFSTSHEPQSTHHSPSLSSQLDACKKEKSSIKKAVILARGLGTRMRAADSSTHLTKTQSQAAACGVKGMIDIGRPFLDYVISALADAGITSVCLVIGPEHDIFRNYYGNLSCSRIHINFAIQEKPLGTANAVAAAQEFSHGDPFIVLNSDNYYPSESLHALSQQGGNAVVGFRRQAMIEKSHIAPERITAFAILDVENGFMKSIIEKPSQKILDAHPDGLISMNAWAFTARIFEACSHIKQSARGEYEIIDAVLWMIQHGEKFPVIPVNDGVLDMSKRSDIILVQQALKSVEVKL